MDRGAWWAAVYGAAQNQTRLKQLTSSSSSNSCSNSRIGGWELKKPSSLSCLWKNLDLNLTQWLNGEGSGTPLQYPYLENPMDGGAWWAAVHGVAKSRTWLSDFTFAFYFHALEKEMATHSSVLAWRILGTGEPGGLLSMGSHRVGHDWSHLAAAAAAAVD